MATISEALAIAAQHYHAGRLQQAEQTYRQILAVDPKHPDALHLLGLVFSRLGRPNDAVESIRRAIASKGNEAIFHSNLGAVLRDLGRLDEAIASCRRALELKPDYIKAYSHLGAALNDRGNHDEAVACYQQALDLSPQNPEVWNNLGSALKDLGRVVEAVGSFRKALDFRADYFAAHRNLLYTLWFCPGVDQAAIYEEHCRWNERWAEPLGKDVAPHANERSLNRRLRIGYVSPDFREHCQAFFTVPLFSAHDREQFEIVCYADVVNPDGLTERLRRYVDQWRDIVGLNDEQIAQLVRQDEIDILIDLTMHMDRGHPLAFARKPAPVQVCWLAYPGTTGLKAIDYRLTDSYLDPPGMFDRYYSEQSIRLRDCFWCYDPLADGPAVNSLPANANGFITFGCLNNFCKLNEGVLELWARVLKAVEQSRLLLLAPEGSAREHVLRVLDQMGIAVDRIAFVARQPRASYLELYHKIDVGLDTFPYNGHTTSLDSFWMGVPVVTLVGQTVVGRAGLCQLQNLGLPELIAQTPEQFVEIAVGLATDLSRLSRLRADLRERMTQSPLMDAPRFARSVEAAYRSMWEAWCAAPAQALPMATTTEVFQIAAQHYQAGKLESAEQICRQIVADDADHADALHLLGLIAARVGQHAAAIELMSRAIALKPADSTFHSNLGSLLMDQGRAQEAAAYCQRAIELNANSAAAHYNLGAALQAQGKLDEAIACFGKALELRPAYAEAHNNLGTAYLALGRLDDAACCFLRAVGLKPDFAVAYHNLGTACQVQGKLEEAVASFRRAIQLDPRLATAQHNLGAALQAQGQLDEAIDCYRRALELKPNDAEAHNNLGAALQAQGKLDEAVDSYCRSLQLNPHYAAAHYNLGTALQSVGNLEEALACFQRALKIKPDDAAALNNLGKTWDDLGKPHQAIETYYRALALSPNNAITHSNLGSAFSLLRRFDEALASYDQALELKADCAEARFGKSILTLLAGDFERGWPEYEWRWQTNKVPHRHFCEPLWDGSPLERRTILLHAEQGFGDTIQFVRYAAVIKKHHPAATVMVECQPPLKALLEKCPGIDRLFATGEPLPPFDIQAPLLSLPGILKTTLESIPAEIPYLFADSALVAQWRERLRDLQGLRVGVSWRGRPTTRLRDIPVEQLQGLAEMPGIHLISLQKGATRAELAAGGNRPRIIDLGDDLDTAHGPFMDTAAVMMNLDVVISSDTAIPHLAGALGVPVWLALPYVPDWRWLLDRADSPWYPTMRIFRQRAIGDWTPVFDELRTDLEALRSGKT